MRDLALATLLTALISFPALATIPETTEREVFQELLTSVDRLKLDFEGAQMNLSQFLSRNLLSEPFVTFNVQNKCEVRNRADDYTCKITLNKYASPAPTKARHRDAFRIDYIATTDSEGRMEMHPWSVHYHEIVKKHVPPKGFKRMDAELERLTFKALLVKAPEIRLRLVKSNPLLTEHFSVKMLNNNPYTVSFRNRCYGRLNETAYACSLTAVVYRWYKRNPARLQSTLALEYNAGGSRATGIALPGRFKSVSYR